MRAITNFPNQSTRWDGHYFTTCILPGGRVVRVRDDQPWPPRGAKRVTVAGVDNGMQPRAYYRQQLAELRAAVAAGELGEF